MLRRLQCSRTIHTKATVNYSCYHECKKIIIPSTSLVDSNYMYFLIPTLRRRNRFKNNSSLTHLILYSFRQIKPIKYDTYFENLLSDAIYQSYTFLNRITLTTDLNIDQDVTASVVLVLLSFNSCFYNPTASQNTWRPG